MELTAIAQVQMYITAIVEDIKNYLNPNADDTGLALDPL